MAVVVVITDHRTCSAEGNTDDNHCSGSHSSEGRDGGNEAHRSGATW